MLLTVSGPAGGGKTTFAEGIADALGYEHVSGGDIFRSLAAERGHSLVEFNRLAEEDDQVDRDLDRRIRSIASDRDDVVLEGRLAGWMAGEYADLRFWIDAPLAVRVQRIADREGKSVDVARDETEERAASEARRYEKYYGIDIEDRSIYDLVINTARWDVDAELEIALAAVEAYDPEVDEGRTPVTGVDYDF